MSDSFDEKKMNLINQVSASFCTAKWLQVTIDLINGTTHSCHHPQRHPVPLSELENNPSALHNTSYKKQQRIKMLNGVRPTECSYCWNIEDLGNQYSDRYIKTTDPWAWPDFEKIKNLSGHEDIAPRYVEVMLDNVCNFSCAYCMADISTGVALEMKKYGGYPVSNPYHRLPQAKADATNHPRFIQAFEKWLPMILGNLHTLRITGGEPLLSPNFWKLLNHISDSGQSNLNFIVNSHLNHRPETIHRLCDSIESLLKEKKIKSFAVYTSLDTHGTQAEYIRFGLNYDLVIRNIKTIQSRLPDTECIVMCTFNILSIGSFDKFLHDIAELKKTNNVILDVSYLKNPEYLRADIANAELTFKLEKILESIPVYRDVFSQHEINKIENLVQWVKSRQEAHLEPKRRSDFFRFINEYDKRKKSNFNQLFPEYKSFYISCKQMAFLMGGPPL